MEDDKPPPYEAAPEDDLQEDALIEPTIFVLAGLTVHVETANSPPAYELSRAVAHLSKATERVAFARFDQIIGSIASDEAGAVVPIVKRRRRHLYDLRRTAKQPRIGFSRARSSTDAPEYYIHSVSRRTIGHVGLSKFSHGGFSAGFTALPVHITPASQPRYSVYKPAVFKLQRKDNRSEWMSTKDQATIAVEDMADDEHRLIFMKAPGASWQICSCQAWRWTRSGTSW